MPLLAARLLEIRGPRDDHFGIALLISLAAHAALLTLHFSEPAPLPPRETTLEVTLLNVRGDTPTLQPQVIAQHDFDGGGTDESGVASTPLPLTHAEAPAEIVLASLLKKQAELEAEQARLLALLEQRADAAAADETPSTLEPTMTGEDELTQESLIINSRIAALKEKVEHYNARPRIHFVGPAAASAAEARYLEAWRQKIETLGTEHYPPEARGRLYGSLQLTVFVRKDGSLFKVEIDRASIHPVLNQAALRIVQLAAPFPPLPVELAEHFDVLGITRTWHFTHEQLETRAADIP